MEAKRGPRRIMRPRMVDSTEGRMVLPPPLLGPRMPGSRGEGAARRIVRSGSCCEVGLVVVDVELVFAGLGGRLDLTGPAMEA